MKAKWRIDRRRALGLLGGAALVPVAGTRVSAQTLDTVSFQTNWRAQAEHGGYYQAVAAGIYRRYGIACDLRMGGPMENPSQLLLAGRVDMIMSNGFIALNYVRENLPFLTIAAIMQKDPQVLITHEGNGIERFEDMRGRPILVSPECTPRAIPAWTCLPSSWSTRISPTWICPGRGFRRATRC